MMWIPRRAAFAAVAGTFMGLLAGGCATREVPRAFPVDSAASPEAKEAPPARVGVALAEDPPLPGEPAAGWPGLEQDAQRGHGGAGHHHHHHHQDGATPPASPSKPDADGGAHGGHAH